MTHAVIERFVDLESTFLAEVKKSERTSARFAAAAGLDTDMDAAQFVRRSLRERKRLNEELGNWKEPSKQMRLVYGAVLAASNKDAGLFLMVRDALLQERKRRGGRALTSQASGAALALAASGGGTGEAGMFFDLLEAIAAPWWRRTPAPEEAFAAYMAAQGETPDTALAYLGNARLAMQAAGVPKNAIEKAIFDVAMANPSTSDYAAAWTSLNIAVRGQRGLIRTAGFAGLAKLAAQVDDGSAAGDALIQSAEALTEMRPKMTGIAGCRMAVRLAVSMTGRSEAGAAARDMSAVLAAQAAMIAATVAATTAVVAAT